MTKTTSILDRINADAVAFRQAQAKYDKAFRLLKITTPEIQAADFWLMVDAFRLTILRTMNYRTEGVTEAAADEFMRQAAIGESPWGLPAAVHFALSYDTYKRHAYSGGDGCGFDFGRGDDGYGDLMDAVVLLGREFNERLHASRFYDLKDFNAAVEERCAIHSASRLRKFILQGENYCGMMLCDAAQKWIALEAMRGTKENDE